MHIGAFAFDNKLNIGRAGVLLLTCRSSAIWYSAVFVIPHCISDKQRHWGCACLRENRQMGHSSPKFSELV